MVKNERYNDLQLSILDFVHVYAIRMAHGLGYKLFMKKGLTTTQSLSNMRISGIIDF